MSVERGREAFFFGDLEKYRRLLGISKSALAEILGVHIASLYRWQAWDALAKLNDRNAEMVDAFVQAALRALDEYPDFPERWVSYAKVAQHLGLTNEYLMDVYRYGKSSVLTANTGDFGVLGLFFVKERFTLLKEGGFFFGELSHLSDQT